MNNWSEVLTSNVYKYGTINKPNTFYIDAIDGLDNANRSGGQSEPWQTIQYAMTRVTAGQTVHVRPGNYLIPDICDVPVGVSIEGEGDGSNFICSFVAVGNEQGSFRLLSAAEGVDGNQSLSFFRMDGTLTATEAITVIRRSNVKIHHLTIQDFDQGGIYLRGGILVNPVINAVNNEVHHCSIINSSQRGAVNNSLIRLCGQQDILIYNNYLDQTGKAAGSNGNIVGAVDGYNSGLKFFNNVTVKPNTDAGAWNFHIESWDSEGGMEIYDNVFNGGGCFVDIAGTTSHRGTYPYSWYIHDNKFLQNQLEPMQAHFTVGVSCERGARDVFITRNHFLNLQFGVYFAISGADELNNVHVYYNLFENIGLTDNDWGAGIMFVPSNVGAYIRNVYVYNNVIIAAAGGTQPLGGVLSQAVNGNITDVYIRKNIIMGFDACIYIYGGAGQMITLYNQYNIMFNNDNANDIFITAGETVTNYFVGNIIKADPLFIGGAPYNFHLQAASPAINAGFPSFDYVEDYEKHKISTAVNIGMYEQ